MIGYYIQKIELAIKSSLAFDFIVSTFLIFGAISATGCILVSIWAIVQLWKGCDK